MEFIFLICLHICVILCGLFSIIPMDFTNLKVLIIIFFSLSLPFIFIFILFLLFHFFLDSKIDFFFFAISGMKKILNRLTMYIYIYLNIPSIVSVCWIKNKKKILFEGEKGKKIYLYFERMLRETNAKVHI